jgi:hypothetical protein
MPSPVLEPDTSPGMSTTAICAGTIFCVGMNPAIFARRSSGTFTVPGIGAVVLNMKLLRAASVSVIAEKSVVLPELGRPTMPQERPIDSGRAG